jgi:hypothetical protein
VDLAPMLEVTGERFMWQRSRGGNRAPPRPASRMGSDATRVNAPKRRHGLHGGRGKECYRVGQDRPNVVVQFHRVDRRGTNWRPTRHRH